jgi:hypothetical protein
MCSRNKKIGTIVLSPFLRSHANLKQVFPAPAARLTACLRCSMTVARADAADAVSQIYLVYSLHALHRPMMHGKQDSIPLLERNDFRSRLHARLLLGQHELATGHSPNRLGSTGIPRNACHTRCWKAVPRTSSGKPSPMPGASIKPTTLATSSSKLASPPTSLA